MSEEVLAFVISIGLLAALAAWVPFSWFCNSRCQQMLEARRSRRAARRRSLEQGLEEDLETRQTA
jgi:hypothetical protein